MLPRIYRIFSKQKWLAIVLVLGGCAMTSPDPYQTTPSDQRKQRVAGTVLASQLPFGRDLPVVNNKPYADMYFKHYGVNPTIDTGEENVSTFSVDVDTASYTIARAYLERGAMPDEAAIRIEEFINAFDYHYAPPEDYASEPFSAHAELFPSPVRKGFHLLHLGLKAREVADQQRQPANLIFVVDASGSMARENRLGLVKKALRLLVDQLQEGDSVGL
ncbi:MAG: VWA domain-containing protein, partial [Gammaproteobacteria bacterium]|nr:VWA domain-containing protein [Gammaproteobacteria bacterium]